MGQQERAKQSERNKVEKKTKWETNMDVKIKRHRNKLTGKRRK